MFRNGEPLGLPRGSVRALLTLLLLLVLVATLFAPIVKGAEEIRSGLLALCVMAVKDYFTVRAGQNQQDGPPLHPPAPNE